jgi:hypothetical protein
LPSVFQIPLMMGAAEKGLAVIARFFLNAVAGVAGEWIIHAAVRPRLPAAG